MESKIENTVRAVKCTKCGQLHELRTNSYVEVQGDIRRGLDDYLVGGNITNDYEVESVSIYCYPSCLAKVLGISMTTPRAGF